MHISNKFFSFSLCKYEFMCFIYTKKYKYGVTWDDIYGWDYGRATN